MIRFFLIAVVCLLSFRSSSQQNEFIKYYDSSWAASPKESAFYYAEFKKEGNLYKCNAYWAKSKKQNAVGFFADTTFKRPRKLLINYYESGITQDSSFYDVMGKLKYIYHYYPSGKLLASRIIEPGTNKEIIEGFDEKGKVIKNFTYAKEAEYPGGDNAWLRYVSKNVDKNTPVKKGAPKGTYNVMILFMVDKIGQVVNCIPETSHGYGMEEEAIRVLRNSSKWKPASYLGQPIEVYRKQPVTFMVDEK